MTETHISDSEKGIIPSLRSTALRALKQMYLPEKRMFSFRLRRGNMGMLAEGVSRRYTACALIGLSEENSNTVKTVLDGHSLEEVFSGLLEQLDSMTDLGEVALTLWAGRAMEHPDSRRALNRLLEMQPDRRACPTVELAWSLAALSLPARAATDRPLANRIADRMLWSQMTKTGLFPHWPTGSRGHWLRCHVACFADMVYPVQALSLFARCSGNPEALAAAQLCADAMCRLQGPDGQWWWHYDVRTGRIVEQYPVYSVHQDSMAPMAFAALTDASGRDYSPAVRRSVAWLEHAREIDGSLLDTSVGVIWRKVARKEPAKLSRRLQCASSRVHPAFRAPLIDRVFRPGRVDFETRPYHMGWILHAWPPDRTARIIDLVSKPDEARAATEPGEQKVDMAFGTASSD